MPAYHHPALAPLPDIQVTQQTLTNPPNAKEQKEGGQGTQKEATSGHQNCNVDIRMACFARAVLGPPRRTS